KLLNLLNKLNHGAYTAFKESFEEHEIFLVDHIKYFTDNQLDKLGITKYGYQVNIKQVAKDSRLLAY
ncbi:29523_t:CDS:1, partial [Gigaspora margarita]